VPSPFSFPIALETKQLPSQHLECSFTTIVQIALQIGTSPTTLQTTTQTVATHFCSFSMHKCSSKCSSPMQLKCTNVEISNAQIFRHKCSTNAQMQLSTNVTFSKNTTF
jgi:hypothetical protein